MLIKTNNDLETDNTKRWICQRVCSSNLDLFDDEVDLILNFSNILVIQTFQNADSLVKLRIYRLDCSIRKSTIGGHGDGEFFQREGEWGNLTVNDLGLH